MARIGYQPAVVIANVDRAPRAGLVTVTTRSAAIVADAIAIGIVNVDLGLNQVCSDGRCARELTRRPFASNDRRRVANDTWCRRQIYLCDQNQGELFANTQGLGVFVIEDIQSDIGVRRGGTVGEKGVRYVGETRGQFIIKTHINRSRALIRHRELVGYFVSGIDDGGIAAAQRRRQLPLVQLQLHASQRRRTSRAANSNASGQARRGAVFDLLGSTQNI